MATSAWPAAEEFFPPAPTLARLAAALDRCRACPLWRDATQGVGGEGPASARLVLVGEQPGEREDRSGQPFVGSAGRVLDECLEAAGIARADTYVTNAVKHFKFERRGKRRIHQKPSTTEVDACLPWLREELRLVRPALVVCLGATAARALMGKDLRVSRDHGRLFESELAPRAMATYHPSAALRAPAARRQEIRSLIVTDFGVAARYLREAVAS